MQTQSTSEIRRGVVWSLLNVGAAQFLSLLVFLGTARFVSKEAFGIMAVSLATVELVKRVSIESFAIAVTAKNEIDDRDYNACFTLCMICSVGLAATLWLAAHFVAGLLHNPEMAITLRFVSALLVTLGLSRTHEAWLARHLQFKTLAIRSLVSIIFGGVVALYLAVSGYGIWSLVGQQLVMGISSLILLWATCRWRPKLIWSIPQFRDNLRYARFVSFTGIWTFLGSEADIFFVSSFLGSNAAGVYNGAKRIMLAANQFLTTALNRVALSAFANEADPRNQAHMLLKSVRLVSIATAPAFAGLAALSPDIIHILLGPRWADVAPVLSILAASGYILSLGQFNSVIFLTHKRPHYDTAFAFASTVANLAFFGIAIRHGVEALAAAFSLRIWLFAPFSTYVALKRVHLGIRDYVKTIIPSILSAGVMVVALWLFSSQLPAPHPALRLLILIPSGAAIYTAAIWCLDRPTFTRLRGLVQPALGQV